VEFTGVGNGLDGLKSVSRRSKLGIDRSGKFRIYNCYLRPPLAA